MSNRTVAEAEPREHDREVSGGTGWSEMIALAHGAAGARPHPLRAALMFIDTHGPLAEARAVRIATEWMNAGNEAAAVWLTDVCDAIHELERTKRRPGETVH